MSTLPSNNYCSPVASTNWNFRRIPTWLRLEAEVSHCFSSWQNKSKVGNPVICNLRQPPPPQKKTVEARVRVWPGILTWGSSNRRNLHKELSGQCQRRKLKNNNSKMEIRILYIHNTYRTLFQSGIPNFNMVESR